MQSASGSKPGQPAPITAQDSNGYILLQPESAIVEKSTHENLWGELVTPITCYKELSRQESSKKSATELKVCDGVASLIV